MNPAPTPRLWPFVLLIAAAVTVHAALATGGIAYTKRLKTKLLAEPKPMAAATGEVGFGKALTISNVQGSWLQVSGEGVSGWVFNGNISATKPDASSGADNLHLAATETTASAAGRGFDEVSNDYAKRHGLGNAHGDLTWLVEQTARITDQDVDAFLKAQKKGEYK